MKKVTPRCYLIGFSTINMTGLYNYLHDSAQVDFLQSIEEARKANLSDGEILCSFYAKLCYKSLVLGTNANVSRIRDINENFETIISSGHGSCLEHFQLNFVVTNCSRVFCYDPDTEVLTYDGWKNIAQLKNDEVLLTLNPKTKKASWNKNIKLHSFDYTGRMYWLETSQFVSPMITPNHEMYCARYNGSVHQDRIEKYGKDGKNTGTVEEVMDQYAEKITIDQLTNKRFCIDHRIRLNETKFPENIDGYNSGLFFAWLGWVATDGSISNNTVSIAQSKEWYIPIIRNLMNSLFYSDWNEYQQENITVFKVTSDRLARIVVDMIGPNKKERDLRFLYRYHPYLLQIFLHSVVSGDGNRNPNLNDIDTYHEVVYCGYENVAKQYQVLFALTGYSTNIREDDRRGMERLLNGNVIRNNLVNYVISIHKKGTSLIRPQYIKCKYYSGKVYCPETEDGIIYIRYKGMAFWCSNSHEVVRHRVGTAFSQTSGRYVALGVDAEENPVELEMIIDPILDPVIDDIKELEDYTAEVIRRIRQKLDVKNMPFSKKKKLTSAIRRLAPNAQNNEIGISLNLRSLRHLIELRTSQHAEYEIRLIFNQIADIILGKWPHILYGHKREMVDGMYEYTNLRV